MATNFVNPTKVITGVNTRWSYANVWQPKSINGGAPKYSVSLIIPKSDKKTIEKIRAAIQAAYEEGESKLKGNGKSVPALATLKTPLCDGDVILQCFEDGQTVYRLYNPLNNSVSREIRSVKDSVLLLAAIGESYYVSLQDDNGAKTAYIGKEDFWNGAFERAVVLLTEHAN